ncbi:PqqD family peptide modification chaperone [Clostridium sp.]
MKKNIELIIDDIIEKYDVAREICEKEIMKYIEKLDNHGLITIS